MSDDAIDRMEAGDPRDRGDDSAMEEDASNDNERECGRGRVMWTDGLVVLPDGKRRTRRWGTMAAYWEVRRMMVMMMAAAVLPQLLTERLLLKNV
jgi:hypothetical protein